MAAVSAGVRGLTGPGLLASKKGASPLRRPAVNSWRSFFEIGGGEAEFGGGVFDGEAVDEMGPERLVMALRDGERGGEEIDGLHEIDTTSSVTISQDNIVKTIWRRGVEDAGRPFYGLRPDSGPRPPRRVLFRQLSILILLRHMRYAIGANIQGRRAAGLDFTALDDQPRPGTGPSAG